MASPDPAGVDGRKRDMSCGGSHDSNANSAAISASVEATNAAVRDAALTQHEAIMAEAPEGHWAVAKDTLANKFASDEFTDTPQAVGDRATVSAALEEVGDSTLGYVPTMTTDYSGRGMFGRPCAGISFVDRADMDEFHATLRDYDTDLADRMSRDAKVDSMGRGIIAYYPNVNLGAPGHGVNEDGTY